MSRWAAIKGVMAKHPGVEFALLFGSAARDEHGVIARSTSQALSKAVGLRNVVARGYSNIDWQLVHEASAHGEKDLCAFATEISTWVMSRPSHP